MSLSTCAVIRCADLSRVVLDTARSVERQAHRFTEIVLVTDPTTPLAVRGWLTSVAERHGWRMVEAAAPHPGVVWNTGITSSRADLVTCLDAGERLVPGYNAAVLAALSDGADLVTTAMLHRGPGAAARVVSAPPADRATLLSSFDAARPTWTIRRATWAALGGFDPQLSVLEDHEFLLRATHAGHRARVLDAPLVVRLTGRDGLYRRAWARVDHEAAVARILERHAPLFAEAPEVVISGGLAVVSAWYARNAALIERRRAGMAAIDALRARLETLMAAAPAAARRPIDLGDLRRTTPISREWGYERGVPVDRRYIEQFLERHASDVAGAVLEVQEPDYTRRFGGERVTRSDVVDLDPANPRATILSDLRAAANIAASTYDCIILTQTLHVIDDMPAVAAECLRILRPGGVLLATLPCASRVCVEYGQDGDFWRVTADGARRVFAAAFPPEQVTVSAVGNVLTTTAFLYGLGADELTPSDYAYADPYLPTLVTVRATKVGTTAPAVWNRSAHVVRSAPGYDHSGSAVLLYHRVADVDHDVHGLAISPAEFREQLVFLRDHYDVVPLQSLARAIRDGAVAPGQVALTFDDGYADNLALASPALLEAGLPATFFVTTDCLDETGGYWWDALEEALLGPGARLASALTITLPDGALHLATATRDERLAAHQAIHRSIVAAPADVRDRVVAAVRAQSGHTPRAAGARRLTRREVVELASRAGHEIGGHSVRHLMLTRQPDEVRRREIVDCTHTLEALLGRRMAAFAYPFGAWDAATRGAVAAAGVELALACDDAAIPRDADPLSVPRLDVVARGRERFDDWLRRRMAPPRALRFGAVADAVRHPRRADRPRRALVAGWFSYRHSDSTAGDLLACDLACEWLGQAGLACDVALAAPFAGGVDLAAVDPATYSHAVFVCGPFMPNALEHEFTRRFAACTLVGMNLSLPVPLGEWNPFDLLFERNSSRADHPDITFVAPARPVPVVGVCRVEPFAGAEVAAADRAIERLLMSRELAVVPIDTRLDANSTGLRSKDEVESLLARMDAVVTTRLHGTVLALKHGVPVVAIDPERGGGRIARQCAAIGWPAVFAVEALDERALRAALDYCLSDAARAAARACRDRAASLVDGLRLRVVAALSKEPAEEDIRG